VAGATPGVSCPVLLSLLPLERIMIASEIFDEALKNKFSEQKIKFLRNAENIFSEETEETLANKINIIKQRMAEGRSFSEICDDKDVFLGRIDREYVSFQIDHEKNDTGFGLMTLERFRNNYLYREAMNEIR
jgi:hypothetical protein